jgi:hypothetical protein
MCFFSGVGTFLVACYNSFTMTQRRPRIRVLFGLIPIVLYTGMFVIMFTQTEWAWIYPGYICMMVTPVISLINQRQIVCNFTGMQVNIFPMTTLWYLLFPINRYLPDFGAPSFAMMSTGERLFVAESSVAWFIFAITTVWYFVFAVGTVNQICKVLEINCFSLVKAQKRN